MSRERRLKEIGAKLKVLLIHLTCVITIITFYINTFINSNTIVAIISLSICLNRIYTLRKIVRLKEKAMENDMLFTEYLEEINGK